jgi:hypothetical protein
MLRGILFNDPEKFDYNDDNNLMDVITDNCIILCEDTKLKYFLANQIEDICLGNHTHEGGYEYCVGDDETEPEVTGRIAYLPTSIFTIDNEQKITITVEAPFILTAKSIEDIWFAARTNEDKISIYPFKIFKGHKEVWSQGVEKVYRNVINGRYGYYVYGERGKPFSWEEKDSWGDVM